MTTSRPPTTLALAITLLVALLLAACARKRGVDQPGASPPSALSIGDLPPTTPTTTTHPTCNHWGTIDFFRDATPELVRECLRAGADPNGPPGVYPLPPLFVAAGSSPHPAVISILVDAGADLTARHWGGLTPLHEAARQNTNAGVVVALLELAADPNVRTRDGTAPLHSAAARNSNPDIVTVLVEAGADPNARDPNGNTPLHRAWTDMFTDRRPVMRELLRLGADPLARNNAGVVADQTHCDNWNTDSFAYPALPADYARCLDAGADANARDANGQMPLHRALANRDPAVVAQLLGAGADPNAENSRGDPPLLQGPLQTSYMIPPAIPTELARQLLAAGANPNARGWLRNTPLYNATRQRAAELAGVLLEAGADPNAPASFGDTPLYRAASQGTAELVGILLEAGADPNLPDGEGELPLAAATQYGHTEVIRLLEAAGAEVDTQTGDSSGVQWIVGGVAVAQPEALPHDPHYPCNNTSFLWRAPVESLRACLEDGAWLDEPVWFDHAPLAYLAQWQRPPRSAIAEKIALLLAAGAGANKANSQGRTTLHLLLARWEGDGAIVRIGVPTLLDAGADVNARDAQGRTPLHDAVQAAAWARASRQDAIHLVQLLLGAGADVNARTHLGESPMHIAASGYQRNAMVIGDVISALLEAGAEIDARTNDGRTPLHAAVQADRPAAAVALLAAGADPTLRDDAGNLADPASCEHWGRAVFFATVDAEVIKRCVDAGADPNPAVSAGDQNGPWLLHLASTYARDPAVIAALVEGGADVHARDRSGNTPLHAAARNATLAAVRALVQAGVDVDAPEGESGRYSRGGPTPLHNAASNPNPLVAATLLEAGADVGARAWPWGGTPLHVAARNPNPAVAALLLDAGANVRARQFAWISSPVKVAGEDVATRRLGGITALHEAAQNPNPEVLALLLEAGADPGALAWRGENHHYHWSGNVTPLYDAARYNSNPEIVATLVAAGADVDGHGAQLSFPPPQQQTDSSPVQHLSPLYLAVRTEGHPATIEALVRAGANLELTDSDGRTVLHVAAIDYPAVFPLLLRLGADPDALDAEGKTPMDYARANYMLQPWERVRMSSPLDRK
ncbi:MAG: ankyrin repeat domain-containing protein [Gemmatimonadota bacterium]|nr:ankyrin repeat domain-containing protein [Gemmatimonadota bacterium]